MTTHQNGAHVLSDVTTRGLPGGVRATFVTVADMDGVESGIQLSAPDEPLNASTLRDLAAALVDTATALENLAVG